MWFTAGISSCSYLNKFQLNFISSIFLICSRLCDHSTARKQAYFFVNLDAILAFVSVSLMPLGCLGAKFGIKGRIHNVFMNLNSTKTTEPLAPPWTQVGVNVKPFLRQFICQLINRSLCVCHTKHHTKMHSCHYPSQVSQ